MHDLVLLNLGHARTREHVTSIRLRQSDQVFNAHNALLAQRLRERHARLLQANFERDEGVSQGVEFRIESGCATTGSGGGGGGGSSRCRRWRQVREKGAGGLESEHVLVGQLRELHDGQAVTGVALALHAPAAAGRHDELAFSAAHGRVALDVAGAGANEGEENAGICAHTREVAGGGRGAAQS